MKFSREVRIGLIMTVGIAVLFWGVNYLKGIDFFTRQRSVFAVYNQVEGLTSTNPVMVNGMKVGMIYQDQQSIRSEKFKSRNFQYRSVRFERSQTCIRRQQRRHGRW
ncbi:MAG: hypothetical protein IPP27_16700 [Bacteroidetes bacterium]|nr:hypothetical protein [Bacteroidota bacterium]